MKKPVLISRRNFLKQKFLFILYAFLSQYITTNTLKTIPSKRKSNYDILDKLLELPFSPIVREEVYFRVKLQKKYCFDANGYLNPLDRFLREIVYFIIYHKNEKDFDLLYCIQDKQIDYRYLLKTVVKLDEYKSLKKMQKNLLDMDESLLNELLYNAVQSQSFNTTKYILKLNFTLQQNTTSSITTLLSKKEYNKMYKIFSNTAKLPILPKTLGYQEGRKRVISKKSVQDYCFSKQEYFHNLYAIIYNSICNLYLNTIIDDFSVNLCGDKVYVSVWNYNNAYDIAFYQIFESFLITNGFIDWNEQLDYVNSNILMGEEDFFMQQKIYHNSIDHYDVLHLEVL